MVKEIAIVNLCFWLFTKNSKVFETRYPHVIVLHKIYAQAFNRCKIYLYLISSVMSSFSSKQSNFIILHNVTNFILFLLAFGGLNLGEIHYLVMRQMRQKCVQFLKLDVL